MNLADFLLGGRDAMARAIDGVGGPVTYGVIADAVARVSTMVAGRFAEGDRIAVLATNSAFFATSYIGIAGAGCVAVLLDRGAPDDVLAEQIRRVGARAVFVQEKARGKLGKIDLPVFDETACAGLPAAAAMASVRRGEDDDPAVILFTSGSTGQRKGVLLSHRNLIANTLSIIAYQELRATDRACAVLPFHYSYGLSVLNTHLAVGGTVVLPRTMFLGAVVQDLKTHRCTNLAGVPTTYAILLRKTDFLAHRYPDLRFVSQAGGRMPPEMVDELRRGLPGVDVYAMYGQTEASARLSYLPPALADAKQGSIGQGIPGVELRVVDEDGNPVRPGETGEVVAKGDNVMIGYDGDPEATARVLRGGWLWTGDSATVDEDGFIYLQARRNDVIKSAGYRFHPQEVEDIIMSDPGVAVCAVVGTDDPLRGEVPVAFLVPVDRSFGAALAGRIGALAQQRLPSYMQPARIVLRDALPMTPTGKPDRPALRALATQP